MTELQVYTLLLSLSLLAIALGGLVVLLVMVWQEIRETLWEKEE